MRKLAGQIGIVTGASSGYGVGIAKELICAGAKIWITARNKDKLKRVAKRIGAYPIVADVTISKDWDKVFKHVKKKEKKLNILVNNAGAAIATKKVVNQTDEEIKNSIDTNLIGAILGCKRAAKIMQNQKKGTIINISSICAKEAWPEWGIYGAAKAGIEHFTRHLHTELRSYNVRATCITPSWGNTDFSGMSSFDTKIKNKLIQPDNVGRLVSTICTLPSHLVIPEVTLLPLEQEIIPY